jgi:hypothetical protein
MFIGYNLKFSDRRRVNNSWLTSYTVIILSRNFQLRIPGCYFIILTSPIQRKAHKRDGVAAGSDK